MNKEELTFSVSSLNRYIKSLIDNTFVLQKVMVKGEVSNLKVYPSGHVYFSLKDEESSLKAVMFYDYAKNLDKTIQNGDEVIATGKISVYVARGEYQLYAEAMEHSGKGSQLLELELLKKKLAAEGLFDESRKRKLNPFPKCIGIISAPNSAALSDIKTNLLRRNPLLELKIFPSLVQGEGATKSLLKALNEAKNEKIDTLIIGRGGGASEDLNAFNDETLVREAAKFPVPIISAVGHEIDFTLIDYVADKRASTPTGAAELATIDKREIYQMLDNASGSLDEYINLKINRFKDKITLYKKNAFFMDPSSMYKLKREQVKKQSEKLDILMKSYLSSLKEQISLKKKHLIALSPKSVLNRGYSILMSKEGKVIKSVKDVKIDEITTTNLKDGVISSKVIRKD